MDELPETPPDHFGARFGRLVRSYREDQGMSVNDLALELWEDKDNAPGIIRLERGVVRKPRAKTIQRYALALNIPQGEINALREPVAENATLKAIEQLRQDLRSIRSDPPVSTTACLAELKQIDDRLGQKDLGLGDRHAGEERRRYLLSHLGEGLKTDSDPGRYTTDALRLLKPQHWNNGANRQRMVDYISPISTLLMRAREQDGPDFVELVLLATDNLYLNDRKIEGHAVIGAFRDRLLNPRTAQEHALILANADIPLESGHMLPADYQELGGRRASPLNSAAFWRCRTCRLARNEQYPEAFEALETAREELARVPVETPGRANIAAYLSAIAVIMKWRYIREPSPSLEAEARSALSSTLRITPRSKVHLPCG